MKNSSDTIGNRTRDLPNCSAVSQPTAPPRAPMRLWTGQNKFLNLLECNTALIDKQSRRKIVPLFPQSCGPKTLDCGLLCPVQIPSKRRFTVYHTLEHNILEDPNLLRHLIDNIKYLKSEKKNFPGSDVISSKGIRTEGLYIFRLHILCSK